MTGLVKQKKYDWKDSNLSLFGSKLEKDIKQAAAETEKAWHVVNAEDKAGLFIWRIVKFVPTPWAKEEYGSFYNGDSYIILNKYQKEGEEDWEYDVHFWIGAHSTQDEYGTAAYKTVELDTFLKDKAIQHREVQNHESDLFKTYFDELTILDGGADSGFRHVTPDVYKPRLIQIKKEDGKRVRADEVPFSKKSINSDDVFVLDFGEKIYQFNGKTCSIKEKTKAQAYVQKLRDAHNAKLDITDESSSDWRQIEEFMSLMPDEEIVVEPEPEGAPDCKVLYQVSDKSGSLVITKVAEGSLNKGMLKREDVFFIDTGRDLTVWIGKGASKAEINCGMVYGHNFLKDKPNPVRPIRQVRDGREDKEFYKTLISWKC
ncbi:severin-like isoform X2 [Lineus longissimus]|uniref:severin-like isoform X2 n=1 Tax=Lineus longissimus TaxID=88925 RepID=UPI002B4D5A16